jgi:hypothetical protein
MPPSPDRFGREAQIAGEVNRWATVITYAAMPKRLLIAAGEVADSTDALPFGVRELIDAADEVLVVTPALPTRFEWLASATDKAREQADERLREVMGHIAELGTEAGGEVGADDPLLAFEDALAGFSADHILVALRAPDRAGWQERGLLDQLLDRFAIPVTVFSLGE